MLIWKALRSWHACVLVHTPGSPWSLAQLATNLGVSILHEYFPSSLPKRNRSSVSDIKEREFGYIMLLLSLGSLKGTK